MSIEPNPVILLGMLSLMVIVTLSYVVYKTNNLLAVTQVTASVWEEEAKSLRRDIQGEKDCYARLHKITVSKIEASDALANIAEKKVRQLEIELREKDFIIHNIHEIYKFVDDLAKEWKPYFLRDIEVIPAQDGDIYPKLKIVLAYTRVLDKPTDFDRRRDYLVEDSVILDFNNRENQMLTKQPYR